MHCIRGKSIKRPPFDDVNDCGQDIKMKVKCFLSFDFVNRLKSQDNCKMNKTAKSMRATYSFCQSSGHKQPTSVALALLSCLHNATNHIGIFTKGSESLQAFISA